MTGRSKRAWGYYWLRLDVDCGWQPGEWNPARQVWTLLGYDKTLRTRQLGQVFGSYEIGAKIDPPEVTP